jgi:hypothetical protein
LVDVQDLVVVAEDPAVRAGDVREPALGQSDLAHGRRLRAGEKPPQDLTVDAGCERGGVRRDVNEREQPAGRAEQRRRPVADSDAGGGGFDGGRPGIGRGRRLQQQRGDHLRAQLEHEGEERLVVAGLHDVPDHRQFDRHGCS